VPFSLIFLNFSKLFKINLAKARILITYALLTFAHIRSASSALCAIASNSTLKKIW